MNIDHWREFAARYVEECKRCLRSGNYVDIWGIDEIGNKELHYCSILAWLIDANGDHGQENRFLLNILNCISSKSCKNEDWLSAFKNDKYTVQTEVVIPNGRLDIFLNSKKILLAIEAKIGASEHNSQLGKYANWLKTAAENNGQNWYLLYLTRDGGEGSSSEVLSVSWEDIGDSIRKTLKEIVNENLSFEDSIAFAIIRQYCDRISCF